METDPLNKKYYKIKDVADMVGVPQSTLRFWESEFREDRKSTRLNSSH